MRLWKGQVRPASRRVRCSKRRSGWLQVFVAAFMVLLDCASPSPAYSPREAVNNGLLTADQQLRPFMESVARFLKEKDRWPPSGADLQMMQQIQMLGQQIEAFGKENSMRQPYMLLRPKMQAMEQMATAIEQLLMGLRPSEEVIQSWGQARAAFVAANRAFYAGAGSPGWERYYDSDVPSGANPRDEKFKYYVYVTQRESEELTKVLEAFLRDKGRWNPAPTGPDMDLVATLETLKQLLGRLSYCESHGQGCDELEPQVVKVNAVGQEMERLIVLGSVNQETSKEWYDVRTGISDLTQAFYKQCPQTMPMAEPDFATVPSGQQQKAEPPAQAPPEDSQF